MYLLLIFSITILTRGFDFKQMSDQYDQLRNTIQVQLLNLPNNMLEHGLGIKPKRRRQLDESTSTNIGGSTTNQTNTNNTTKTVNEFDRQGPLIYPNCNYGQPILINVTRYYCYKTLVNQRQYYDFSATDSSSCVIRYRYAYGCHCPPDFGGSSCTEWNAIICDLDQSQANCFYGDKNYYNSNFDGDPACIAANKSSYFSESFRAICYNQYQNKLNVSVGSTEENFTVIWSNYTKGINGLQPQNYKYDSYDPNNILIYQQYAPISDELEKSIYKYQADTLFLNTNILKSSLEFYIRPRVTAINYKMISSSKTQDVNLILNVPQLMGSSNFDVIIQPSLAEPLFGRYSIELLLLIDIYTEKYANQTTTPNNLTDSANQTRVPLTLIATRTPKMLYFRDESYEEPGSPNIINRHKIIFAVVVSFILLVLIAYCAYRNRNKIIKVLPKIFPFLDNKNDRNENNINNIN